MEPRDWYSVDWVAEAILDFARKRFMTLRFSWGMARHLIKNRGEIREAKRFIESGAIVPWAWQPDRPFIEIHDLEGSGPFSFDYHVRNGVIEFIPEVSDCNDLDRLDEVVIDLDPKNPEYEWSDLVDATVRVMDTVLGAHEEGAVNEKISLSKTPLDAKEIPVRNWKLRFSGSRSFHICIQLQQRMEFPAIRSVLKELLDPLHEESEGKFTYRNSRKNPPDILIDIGAVAKHRCVRSLYSMHAKTRLICVPVTCITKPFDRSWASPEAVLSRGRERERFE